MHAFVTSKDEGNLEVAPIVPIWKRPLYEEKKKTSVPKMQLE